MDVIHQGKAHGSVAVALLNNGFDVNQLRPYVGRNGRSFITTVNEDGKQVAVPTHNEATLRKDEWIQLDQAVVKAAKPRLQAVSDLRAAGLQYVIPNGMGKTVLQTETQGDISPAILSMDGLRESQADRPTYDITNLPLPIIHKDFHFSARQIATSRNGSTPLDTSMAELSSRQVAEMAEQLLLGTAATYAYAGGTIYGFANWPSAIPKVLTDPTDSDWTPAQTVQDVLNMRQLSQAAYHYGPWNLYVSTNWDEYLDDDYSAAKGDNTLRERLMKIQGINKVQTLDYLEDYDMVLVQMTPDVARVVVGMDITTLQWETHGGMLLNFKVMAILVPQLRVDQNGNGGVVYGAVA